MVLNLCELKANKITFQLLVTFTLCYHLKAQFREYAYNTKTLTRSLRRDQKLILQLQLTRASPNTICGCLKLCYKEKTKQSSPHNHVYGKYNTNSILLFFGRTKRVGRTAGTGTAGISGEAQFQGKQAGAVFQRSHFDCSLAWCEFALQSTP